MLPKTLIKLTFYLLIGVLTITGCQQTAQQATSTEPNNEKPNFVLIFCDDLGYGDLSSFGHPSIKTPHLDRLASEGQKWTNFYVAANVCTPSRAALLTGRFPVRTGMCSDNRRVLFPDSDGGLPQSEVTIARALKKADYASAAVGKWHLGHLPEYLPHNHGFDSYFGIPYSNDMDRVDSVEHYASCYDPKVSYFQVPLMRNEEVIERPADQTTITKRYTEEAVKFINDNKEQPFFLYLAHSMPHVPLFASEQFEGKSKRGIYGDVIEEIDWSVGQVVQALKDNGLEKNTLVIFTSDNGPWVIFKEKGGSSGPLYGSKGTSYEGGVREPTIFWWPGQVENAIINDIGSTLDIYPTICQLAGVKMPDDRIYDGYDLSGVLQNQESSPRNEMIYYHGTRIFAARKGDYKLYFYKNNPDGYPEKVEKLETKQLFNVQVDPKEQYEIAASNPEIIKEIEQMVADHRANMTVAETQLEKRIKTGEMDYGEKSL